MRSDSSTRPVADRDDATDQTILGLLLTEHPGLWSVGEVERELANPVAAQDSLGGLTGAGLIHRLGEFVFATRTATLAAMLHEG